METRRHYLGLQFKITLGLLLTLLAVLTATSLLRYASFQDLMMKSLEPLAAEAEEIIGRQLITYRRSRLLLSGVSVLMILLVFSLVMRRTVVRRLEKVLTLVRRGGEPDLDEMVTEESHDEIAELAEAFYRMADRLGEREGLEQEVIEGTEKLHRQAEKLAVLNALAVTVGQSLDLAEVLDTALERMLELMKLRAGWVVLRDGDGDKLDLRACRGLPASVARAQVQCRWDRSICPEVLDLRQARLFPDLPAHSCPVARHFGKEGLFFRACVPLASKNRVLGIMSLVGDASEIAHELTGDMPEMLTAVGRQIGVAVENASLYEELRQKETLRRQLLERVITVQEEERKRIARELHDQTGQPLTFLIMTLKVLEEARSLTEVRARIEDLRDTVLQILKQVHDLAFELRPSVLDDLGLLAALRHYLRGYKYRFRLPIDLQVVGFDGHRLSPDMETALFRIVQEALTNVARHAQASNVSVVLENRATSVMLIVEDNGRGFDVTRAMGLPPHEENLGLYGMRERASLLGGSLTIESTPGTGTTVFVEMPLE